MRKLLLLLLLGRSVAVHAQTTETHHYAIEMAGIRVGTMTTVRQQHADNRSTYTLVSDVKVSLLVYTVKIYYKVISQFEGTKLLLSTVESRSNRGNYASRTEWKGDRYEITADQYKYKHQATERNAIDFTVSNLYFDEPVQRSRAYAEYFGDYFKLGQTAAGTYRALLADREDEYVYEEGRLVKIIKHNKVKNFVVRLLD